MGAKARFSGYGKENDCAPPLSPIHDHRTPHLIMARVGLRLAELTQPEAQGRV